MKNSIVTKVLVILGSFIIVISVVAGYSFWKNVESLLTDIRTHNTNSAMMALNKREKYSLSSDEKRILDKIRLIAKNSSEHLQNFDKKALEKILVSDIRDETIMLIQVLDYDIGESFLTVFKQNTFNNKHGILSKSIDEDGQVFSGSNMSKKIKELDKIKRMRKFTYPIVEIGNKYENDIGAIVLYYDNSKIKDKINILENQTIQEMSNFDANIDKKIKQHIVDKLFIYLIGLVFVLFIMTMLLKKLINTPLQKLKTGLDDFFLVLQNRKKSVTKIDLSSNDEFGEMAYSVNENIKTSIDLHNEVKTLNETLSITSKKEETLLNNAVQGFLTFDEDFIVDTTHSRQCLKFLGKDISHKDITSLLFSDKKDEDKFKSLILTVFEMDNPIIQTSMLSLLPDEIFIDKRFLKLEYKIVGDLKTMLIITDISEQKKLEKQLKEEENIMQMVMTIMEESDTFHYMKNDFKYFAENKSSIIDTKKTPSDNLSRLYRAIHTFKGSFSQFFMNESVSHLHKVESQLSEIIKNNKNISNEDILKLIEEIDFSIFTDDDYKKISELLGEEFVNNDNLMLIDGKYLKVIEDKYTSFVESLDTKDKPSEDILNNIHMLSQKKLISYLNPYISLSMQIAQKLGKEIYEFEIIGNADIIVPRSFDVFFRSLIHLFRNSVDHGIEIPDKRLELDKDELGTIACSFNVNYDKIEIIISDDGAGIDVEKIKMKISEKVDISTLSDEDIYQYIFTDNISTKDSITDISGRGIGMGAVKQEIDNLGGTIKIQSKINIGTTFVISLPFKQIRRDIC